MPDNPKFAHTLDDDEISSGKGGDNTLMLRHARANVITDARYPELRLCLVTPGSSMSDLLKENVCEFRLCRINRSL